LTGELSIDLKKNWRRFRRGRLAADLAGRKITDIPQLMEIPAQQLRRVAKIAEAVLRLKAVDVERVREKIGFADHFDRSIVLGL
jgi:hypothetical protein